MTTLRHDLFNSVKNHKMCKKAITTIFSWTQLFPFLITAKVILRGSFPYMLNKEKRLLDLFSSKNRIILQLGFIILRRKMSPGHYSVGVIILLYTGSRHIVSTIIACFKTVRATGATLALKISWIRTKNNLCLILK